MNELTKEVTQSTEEATALSAYTNSDQFELSQRAGKMLAASDLVPQQFRGNVANCVIGLNIASRLGADPFAVLQSLYIVHGRPAWSAQFLIAMVNASGRFTPLQFKMIGQGDDLTCVAHAKDKETGDPVEGPPISIRMAKEEGWHGKNGSKWKTMPDLMLRYRAGAFFARLYAPDLCLGMRTMEEEVDIRDANAREQPAFQKIVKPKPKPEPKPGAPVPIEVNAAPDPILSEVAERAQPEPEPEPEPDERQIALGQLLERISDSAADNGAIETVLKRQGFLGANGTIARLGAAKLQEILTNWLEIEAQALNQREPNPFDEQ